MFAPCPKTVTLATRYWYRCPWPGERAWPPDTDFSLPISGLKMTGVECVEGMASGLYQELFVAVVSLINR